MKKPKIDKRLMELQLAEEKLEIISDLCADYDGFKGNAEGLESLLDDIRYICIISTLNQLHEYIK